MNRLSEITNLCLEVVKERIAAAEFGSNYPDRSSDLTQSMQITTGDYNHLEVELSCQDSSSDGVLSLFDRTVNPSVRQFVSHRAGKGKRAIKGKKNCSRNDVMAEEKRQLKLSLRNSPPERRYA